jgi:hypothetical protein
MELNYMVRGADGKEYGPASLELLGGWVKQGRLRPQTELKRSDMEHWAHASDFTELQPLFSTPESTVATGAPVMSPAGRQAGPATAAQMRSGASWFYWIAGLSLVNTIAAYAGWGIQFAIGLGITQVFDGIGSRMASGGTAVALVLDILAAGILILFGFFASKGHSWAFIVGMILFALDGLLLVIGSVWIGVAIHAFVLYCLFKGFTACRQMNRA